MVFGVGGSVFINVTHYGKANHTDNFFINELHVHVLVYVVAIELQFAILSLLVSL